jgi:hypothetical protein
MTNRILATIAVITLVVVPFAAEAKTPLADRFIKTKIVYSKTCTMKNSATKYCGNWNVQK